MREGTTEVSQKKRRPNNDRMKWIWAYEIIIGCLNDKGINE